MGLSKQSFNIAARAELAQYPVDVFIKVQSLKYLARISSDGNNPLLIDVFSLSKSLHSVGIIYSWFSYVENICKFDNIDINIIQDNNNSHKNSSFNKDIKQKQKYEEFFFDKLKLTKENSKIYIYIQ